MEEDLSLNLLDIYEDYQSFLLYLKHDIGIQEDNDMDLIEILDIICENLSTYSFKMINGLCLYLANMILTYKEELEAPHLSTIFEKGVQILGRSIEEEQFASAFLSLEIVGNSSNPNQESC